MVKEKIYISKHYKLYKSVIKASDINLPKLPKYNKIFLIKLYL